MLVLKCTIDYMDRVQALANNYIWADQANKKISQTSSLSYTTVKEEKNISLKMALLIKTIYIPYMTEVNNITK